MMLTMVKKQEVLHSQQFVDWFRECNTKKRADPTLYNVLDLDLRQHHYWLWDPEETGPPTRVVKFVCKALNMNRFWMSTPIKGQLSAVDIQVAPITPVHVDFKMPHLVNGQGYHVAKIPCEEKWERARAVPPPKTTNTVSILNTANDMRLTVLASHSQKPDDMRHYNVALGKDQKRKAAAARSVERETKKGKGDACPVPQKYTMEELKQRQMKELQEESKMHAVPHYGNVKDLAGRLQAHYTSFTHSRKPGGARADSAPTFYNTLACMFNKQREKAAETEDKEAKEEHADNSGDEESQGEAPDECFMRYASEGDEGDEGDPVKDDMAEDY